MINSCHALCETTYQSCFDGCNGDGTCEAACLVSENTCDTTCAASDYAGNIHNFLWGGSLYEPETGLYWMRNRYYHKDMHRFINQDPIGIWGDANNLGNGFAYVAGMVIEASDPTGLDKETNESVGCWVSESGMSLLGELMDKVEAPGAVGVAANIIGSGVSLGIQASGGASGEEIVFNNVVSSSIGFIIGNAVIGAELAAIILDIITKDTPSRDDSIMAEALGGDAGKYKDARESAVGQARGALGDTTPSKGGGRSGDQSGTDGGVSTTAEVAHDAKTGEVIGEIITATKDGKSVSFIIVSDGKGGFTTHLIESDKNGEFFEDKKGKHYVKRGKKNNNYPLDPDDAIDRVQSVLMGNILRKMLKLDDTNPIRDQMIIRIEGDYGDGRIVFVRNPYYWSKDPVKRVNVIGTNGAGKPIFGINPFAPKDGSYWRSKFEQGLNEHRIVTPEIDFWE